MAIDSLNFLAFKWLSGICKIQKGEKVFEDP
jgi:hypothetical protein